MNPFSLLDTGGKGRSAASMRDRKVLKVVGKRPRQEGGEDVREEAKKPRGKRPKERHEHEEVKEPHHFASPPQAQRKKLFEFIYTYDRPLSLAFYTAVSFESV